MRPVREVDRLTLTGAEIKNIGAMSQPPPPPNTSSLRDALPRIRLWNLHGVGIGLCSLQGGWGEVVFVLAVLNLQVLLLESQISGYLVRQLVYWLAD